MPRSLDDVCTGWYVVNGIKPSCIHPKHDTHIFIMMSLLSAKSDFSSTSNSHRSFWQTTVRSKDHRTISMFFSKTRQFAPSLPSLQNETSNTSGPNDLDSKSGIRFGIGRSLINPFWFLDPGQIHKKKVFLGWSAKTYNKISRTRIILTKTTYLFNFMPPDTTKVCLCFFQWLPPNPPQNLRNIRSPPFRLRPFFWCPQRPFRCGRVFPTPKISEVSHTFLWNQSCPC